MSIVVVKQLSDKLGVAFGTSGVRGLVKDLTPELCFAFIRSFLQEVCPAATLVAVGTDLRPSSPDIVKAGLAAIEASGAEVIYCGALPTPALAFFAMQNNIPAVMITGSHIPFDRNGIKFYRPDGEINKADEIAIMEGLVSIPAYLSDQIGAKYLPDANSAAIELFKARYLSLFSDNMLKGKFIGVYEHSSVARDLIKELLTQFGAEVVSLGRTDTFVPIDTEAVSDVDKAKGIAWAKANSLDAIVSTDGDGDRPLIGDENGCWLRGDIIGVLCAGFLKASHVAAPVNVNTVLELEGQKQEPKRMSFRTKIGSPFVIEEMLSLLKLSASGSMVVGYEANGGFLVGSDSLVNGQVFKALPTRDAILPILIILFLSSKLNVSISKLADSIAARFTASDRLENIPSKYSASIMAELKNDGHKQSDFLSSFEGECVHIDEIDGLRFVLSNDDIIHLRPSGNAPELRVYSESSTQSSSENLVEKALQNVKKILINYKY